METAAKAGIGFGTLTTVKARSRRVVRKGKAWWEWVWPDDELPPLGPIF